MGDLGGSLYHQVSGDHSTTQEWGLGSRKSGRAKRHLSQWEQTRARSCENPGVLFSGEKVCSAPLEALEPGLACSLTEITLIGRTQGPDTKMTRCWLTLLHLSITSVISSSPVAKKEKVPSQISPGGGRSDWEKTEQRRKPRCPETGPEE